MGIFDELAGGALKKLFASKGNSQPASGISSLFNMAVGMVTQNGLDSFVNKMTKSGLEKQVKSWVGTGKNKSVTASKITQILGPKVIGDMVEKTGMKKTSVTKSLAAMLPEIINNLTPNGKVDEDEVKSRTDGFDFGNVKDILGKFF